METKPVLSVDLQEKRFYCPFMGHKYYETCAMFVILMGHIMVVMIGVSQQFKTEEVSRVHVTDVLYSYSGILNLCLIL